MIYRVRHPDDPFASPWSAEYRNFASANRHAMGMALVLRGPGIVRVVDDDGFVAASYRSDGHANVAALADEIGVRWNHCRPGRPGYLLQPCAMGSNLQKALGLACDLRSGAYTRTDQRCEARYGS